MARYLLANSKLLDSNAISSVTSQAGPGPQAPTETSVTGNLRLAVSGTPTDADVDLDFELKTGGNPAGFDPANSGQASGAQLLVKDNGAADSTFKGFDPRIFLNWVDSPPAATASAGDQYAAPSTLRQLSNGKGGYACYHDAATDKISFFHKTTRTGAWTEVTVFTDGDSGITLTASGQRCALVKFDNGHLTCFFIASDPYTSARRVVAYNSTDHGATWTLLNATCVIISASYDMISAEVIDGDVVMVAGDQNGAAVQMYLSSSRGAVFAKTGGANATYFRPVMCKSGGTVLVIADDNSSGSSVFQLTVAPGGSAATDGDWVETTMEAAGGAGGNHSKCLVVDDDATIWCYIIQAIGPAEMNVYATVDGGVTWVNASPDSSASAFGFLGNPTATEYPLWMAGGVFNGLLLVIANMTSATATSGSLYNLTFGGWTPSVTERPLAESNGEPYKATYIASDLPATMGWTKANVGAGATVSRTGGFLRIAGGAADQSYWSGPAAWLTEVSAATPDACRVRFIFKADGATTESMSDDRAMVYVATISGGSNQWFKVRVGNDNIALVDSTGTLQATGFNFGTGAFTVWTEVLLSFLFDGGATANTGLLSLWYRHAGTEAWTRLADAEEIALDAGTTVQNFVFGGTQAGALTWDLMLLEMSGDSGNMAGFANASDMRGRPVGTLPMYVDEGVSVHGLGTGGIQADEWRFRPGFQYPASYFLDVPSPKRHARSTAETEWTLVLDAGANNLWFYDLVTFHGCNVKDLNVQANATDSWGAPSANNAVSSVIKQGTVTTGRKGSVTAFSQLIEHQYASQPSRRFFIHFSGSGNVYEVTDNTDTDVSVTGSDLTAETGTASIFGEAMYDDTAVTTGYRYIRIQVPAQTTADDQFRLGTLMLGIRVTLTEGTTSDYDSGQTDETIHGVVITESRSGLEFTESQRFMRQKVSLSFPPAYRANNPHDQRMEALYRRLGGPDAPVAFVRDSTVTHLDAGNGGLFRMRGASLQRKSRYGEGPEDLVAIPRIELVEIP
jgi:hypothetical protein